MRILWSIHLYPPIHNCGAEYVAHGINLHMQKNKHHTRVLLHQDYGAPQLYYHEGVEVFGTDNVSTDAYLWGDIMCTHLDTTPHTIHMGRYTKRPVIHFVHNNSVYPSIRNAVRKQYMVYNSEWIRKELEPVYNMPGRVLYPPCDYYRYKFQEQGIENKYVTLINVNVNKGGYVLHDLAKAMPSVLFLAIIGSYDVGGHREKIIEKLKTLPNVTLQPATPDISEVYKKTRILLVPSHYESWGRVATEAMINGIPVIACPTAGLLENCKDAAIWLPPRGELTYNEYTGELEKYDADYDVSSAIEAIEKLACRNYYDEKVRTGKQRAYELELIRHQQLNELETFFSYVQRDYRFNANRS